MSSLRFLKNPMTMPITDDQLAALKNNFLNNWLNNQASTVKITFHWSNGILR